MGRTSRVRRLSALLIALCCVAWCGMARLPSQASDPHLAYLPMALRMSGTDPAATATVAPTATTTRTSTATPTATQLPSPTPTATTNPVATCPQLGEWEGTTSDGYTVVMTVSDQPACQVSHLEIVIWCPRFAWRASMGPVPIVDNQFSAQAHNDFQDADVTVVGGFGSATEASGTWFSSSDCHGTWSATDQPEHTFRGVTEQDKPVELGVSADYSMVTWLDLERTVSCDGITSYRGGRITSGSGWPIVDGAFTIDVPDSLLVQGAFDVSYVQLSGTWQGIIAGPYHPFGGSCRSPIGRWSAALD